MAAWRTVKRETVTNVIGWLVIALASGCILAVIVWSIA